ncbi:cystathionine gamma-synthase [Colletotrichum orchidophilum]|uniref:Cystathionine gamma-synthase n=1 Tax=Colletotrichum orchidophilum TaxID=1209926 RepID=A0A1G4B530_9PEZI|nr:cystathionine gamma-synthase [Colletotrichum orchidophilum]OHE96504.1 cystathionine gamma-synthase [Colletotrichum orchidophilum]
MGSLEVASLAEPAHIDTLWSHPLPPAPRHAVTSHIPGWKALVKLAERDPVHLSKVVSMYPRILLHKDCARLGEHIIKLSGLEPDQHGCFLFPRLQIAQACVDYITSQNRTDDLETLASSEVSIRAFESSGADNDTIHVFAVIFPIAKLIHVMPWWSDTGVAISSRLAQRVLDRLPELHERSLEAVPVQNQRLEGPYKVLRERIAYLAERAPARAREKKVDTSDVYLFQSGMAAIYNVHQHLQRLAQTAERKSIILGVSFYETKHVIKKYGTGLKFFPSVTDTTALEAFLREEQAQGRPVLSLWTEYPSNPLLSVPDFVHLRKLADELNFVLVVDDTIGGVCNIDALAVADVVVTSLTKTFSGHADVMGGSAILNPSSSFYERLKISFEEEFVNDLYIEDARILRHNSDDYLHRLAIINSNAKMVTDWLHEWSKGGRSSIQHVFYPTASHDGARDNYEAFMREPTADFTPGYGCLFSLGFKSQEAAAAFYDNLHVYHGPHLGAHRTLALGYTYLIYGEENEAEFAGTKLSPAQIRVSIGLEDSRELLHVFKYAVMKADELDAGQGK